MAYLSKYVGLSNEVSDNERYAVSEVDAPIVEPESLAPKGHREIVRQDSGRERTTTGLSETKK